ncbi:MAG TPA: DUF6270 domain-containing protein [Bacillales bacterium]|nr:DUF6270 domain-containing protein [Bacillales bacterium]
MEKIKIAVFGSCATRDNFNSTFNPDYNKFYTCPLTQFQSSIISTMSKPIPFDPAMLEGASKSEYHMNVVRNDWEKTFLDELIKVQPDFIIMEFFADAHFGCIQLPNGTFITNNRWRIWDSRFYKDLKASKKLNPFSLNNHFAAYMNKWKEAADEFMTFVEQNLPNTRVIVHKARNSNDYIDNGNLHFNKANIEKKQQKWFDPEKTNRQWDQMDDYLIQNYDVDVIDLKHKCYPAFRQHKWGFFYVHYVYEYYHDFLLHLNMLMLKHGKLSGNSEALAQLISHIERLEFEAGCYQRNYYEAVQRVKKETQKANPKKTPSQKSMIRKIKVGLKKVPQALR